MAAGLIQRAGGQAPLAATAVDVGLAKIPAVTGSGAQATPGLDNDAVRVLDSAEQLADKAGDAYVTVERLLTALAVSQTAAGEALNAAGITPQSLNTAIEPASPAPGKPRLRKGLRCASPTATCPTASRAAP